LENICLQKKEQLLKINIDMDNHPWMLSTNPRIEKRIGDILSITK
jgi:hypothetical protein